MSALLFSKSPDSALYLYNGTGDPLPSGGYTVAFLQDPAKTAFPPSYTIAESWADQNGLYLFINGELNDQSAFVEQVRRYLSSAGRQHTRLLWVANGNDPDYAWQTCSLSVSGNSDASQLDSLARISLSGYCLSITRGVSISVNDADGGETAGFTLRRTTAEAFRFTNNADATILNGFGETIFIPLQGETIGCFLFNLQVAKSDDSTPLTPFGSLDAGMKYFYQDEVWQSGYFAQLHYPVINPTLTDIDLYAALDPINPLIPERSYFSFLPPDGSTPQTLTAYYRTWVGHAATLTPQADGDPKLVFAPRPQFADDPSPPYYLTLSGAFTLHTPPLSGESRSSTESDSAGRLMCGVSPVEYVGYIQPTSGTVNNVLTFHPGMSAYSPSFTPDGQSGGSGIDLQGSATTAYVTFTPVGPAAVNYYSQPDESIFYDPSSLVQVSDSGFLDIKELQTKTLGNSSEDAMPMVPLAGLSGYPSPERQAQFEVNAISQARRNRIGAGGNGAVARNVAIQQSEITGRATTRHGMLGFFGTPDGENVPLVKLQLAQSNGGSETLMLAGQDGGDISGIIKSALQSNQLFMVFSNQAKFAEQATLLSTLLSIADIPFDLDPATWEKNGTLIVYKFANESIARMAADLGAWAYPESFTDGALTQMNLLGIIEDIERQGGGDNPDPSFRQIYEAVTLPQWNGIIAFNAEVSLNDMPGQLAGIAAGIDPAAFNAHHLGINISPMTVTNGQLTMKDSALFGLINYIDNSPFQDIGSDYGFKVSMLKILLNNAQIQDFACKIDLMINNLFGNDVTLTPNDGGQNVVTLDGYYQSSENSNTFSFSTSGDLHFKAASQVLDEVEFYNADFVTENPNATANEQGIKQMATHFAFTGLLRYHDVAGFDALSFGDTLPPTPEGDTIPGGLAFANLIIRMTYDLDAEGNSSNRRFSFDAQNLAVDIGASVARPESLFSHFPLKFKQFVQGEPGNTPTGQGYLGVATPITESALIYPWYGLQYELNLGTVGALAGSVGFTATLLIAWSAAGGNSLFTGIKIPGTSPQSLTFSVEGLLGLSIDDIRFLSGTTGDGHTAYTLVFSNLALRLFGQKLPQSAYVDLVLFGNPDPSQKAASLGWYAAYNSGSTGA